jgi:N-acetylneuraminate synthase
MVQVIAEIGCNHKGDLKIAKELVETAANFCKVDAVKFQKRNNKELLSEEEYNKPHINPRHSYGETYGAHREFLEFDLDTHKELKKYCEELGIVYSTSVWDLTSAKEIASINPEFIKIPSAINTNFKVLEYLCKEYSGDIHLSLGMTTQYEEDEIINFFINHQAAKRLILYSCTSGYPVPHNQICLLEITRLLEKYTGLIKDIGFSGHHLGIAPDIAALTLGANVIERHFTLDRTWKGTDHSASLEPDGLRKLKRDCDNVSKALTYKNSDILNIEEPQRKKLKKEVRI